MVSHQMTRRCVLKAVAAASGAWGIARATEARARFRHRGYLGWITDLATEPDPMAAWPSMRLDERLLEDYRRTFDLMKHLDFNEISIWGLYVSRSWPVDIASAVDPKRGAMVEKLIKEDLRKLAPAVARKDKIASILRCIEGCQETMGL